MNFSYVVSIWKYGGPGPDRASADIIVPVHVQVPAGNVPDLASVVQDLLHAYDLLAVHLVRFVDTADVATAFWHPHVFD